MNKIMQIEFSGLCSNCYVIQNGDDYVLVDTSAPSKRRPLKNALLQIGCVPGKLKLIVLTHSDFDHSGNTAYLQEKYSCPVMLHEKDAPAVETGDMFVVKNKKSLIASMYVNLFLRIKRFSPDVFPKDGQDLSEYGIDAKIIFLPGHSQGSIGVLTAQKDLICGDLLENRKQPNIYFPDDDELAAKSVEKLRKMDIHTVYPGHGEAFLWQEFLEE
ncbi:MAG: MBL fold metallo-hydrolase [Spirochaetia bacterium]